MAAKNYGKKASTKKMADGGEVPKARSMWQVAKDGLFGKKKAETPKTEAPKTDLSIGGAVNAIKARKKALDDI
jgi:hypothetical protein